MRVAMLLSKPLRQDRRVMMEARALIDAGHDVTVVQWARRDPEAQPHERLDGVHVVRVPHTTTMRLLGHDLFRNPAWWRLAARTVAALHRNDPFHVVHCHDLDTLPAGVRLKKRLGVRLVFDAHERFHQMIQGNVPPPVPQLAERLERRLLPQVDHLVTVSDTFADAYRSRYAGPVTVVWNAFGGPPGAYRPPDNDRFTIVYIGTFSRDRLFPEAVDALARVDDVALVLGGKKEGVFDAVARAAARCPNVRFLGPVPHDEVIDHTARADLVVSFLDPRNPQYRDAIPTKLFDAMTCGRPILVTDDTAQADFVRTHDTGRVCAYDADALPDAVAALRDDPTLCRHLGENALKVARERFQWAKQVEALVAAYASIA